MDGNFISSLKTVLTTYDEHKDKISNESQTKQYIILPVLRALGFDVNNPKDIISEFTADVAGKKGEKIDYVLKINGKITILIECKHYKNKLEESERGQLERYFNCRDSVDSARIAILTNGLIWKFFTDSKNSNVLDKNPFFIFDLRKKETYKSFNSFGVENFNLENALFYAKEREYVVQIQNFLDEIFNIKEDANVDNWRVLLSNLSYCNKCDFGEKLTGNKIKELIKPFILAREEFLSSLISKRLLLEPSENSSDNEKEFTEKEMEGYRIVLSIAAEICDASQIKIRNLKGLGRSYVLYNNSQRTPILEMSFIGKPNTIKIGKGEESSIFEINEISDLYKHKEKIINTIKEYMK